MNQLFDRLYEYLPKRQRGFVQEQIAAGPGVFFGCAWADALSSQLANNDDVSVFFMGSIENNPKDLEDAQYILDEYHMACGGPNVAGKHPQSLDVLVQLEASPPPRLHYFRRPLYSHLTCIGAIRYIFLISW